MPIIIMIAILVEVLGAIQIAMDFPSRLALFGAVLGEGLSAVLRVLTVLISLLVIVGLWKRLWLGAIAYAITNLIGLASSSLNYIRLKTTDFEAMYNVQADSLPLIYLALYVILVVVLIFAVLRRRDYFVR